MKAIICVMLEWRGCVQKQGRKGTEKLSLTSCLQRASLPLPAVEGTAHV